MKRSKILALYLPQFHEVIENSKWWGEGFTDWTAVKAAQPLFVGHEQPIVPYKKEYYNLLQKTTMENQAKLMSQYGIDGMCIYHYYFKNAKKILEKPAENLLKWTDIDMPFCFSWANESWVRSWSSINDGNPWSEIADQKISHKANNTGILVEQQYGNYSCWEEHFNYLLPFFKDERYIKQDGRPVFFFYKVQGIGCLAEMAKCWRNLAIQAGFPNLYLIGTNCDENSKKAVDEVFIQEPQDTFFQFSEKYSDNPYVEKYIYFDDIWNKILEKPIPQYPVSLGAFCGYDDSPRRGGHATVVYGRTAKKFEHYFAELLRKAEKSNSSFVVINAWNEWGEGMYLEPDEKNEFNYLEAIRNAKSSISNYQKSEYSIYNDDPRKNNNEEIVALRKQLDRYRSFWYALNSMLTLRERGISIAKYLQKKGYKKIAIYGLGMLGKHLAIELKEDGYSISFGIDQSRNQLDKNFPVISLQDEKREADLIIVTVFYDYINIKEKIREKYSCEIISLKTILDELTV